MTLTQTAILTKRLILLSVFALIFGIVSFTGYKIWYAYYLSHLPPVEEKPDIKFGLLPTPEFPQTQTSSSNFSYSLDTTTGSLPKIGEDPGFEKIIKVYFISQTFATLLAPEKSQNLAEKFNILTPPNIINETHYQFNDGGKNLTVNLDNGNFTFTQEATISAQVNLEDESKLVADFKQTLSFLGVLNNDLNNGRTKIVLLKVEGDKFVPTTIRQDAQATQISLWPASIDQKSIFTPDFNKSLVWGIVLGSADKLENHLSLNFTYYPIDTTTFATYPIKSAESAFDDLKNGKGAVIIEPRKPQVSITSVYLGYYLPENYNPYLQPIFVFEGPDFVSFVPAISE
ncbi:hypothetical protein HYT74_03750 [Candidatus Daviesbacteria bacterium]|nr:hypothetical protein [Candidatus Daviesbacteria bacterium]